MSRLQVEFSVVAPHTDETPLIGEPPDARALRLAEEKARAPSADFPDALLIGGDQTIAAGGQIFDKPGTVENAVAQLKSMRGETLRFYTAVCLLNTKTGNMRSCLIAHTAKLRNATDEEIIRYVEKEKALDAGGGAQIEGLGISLMEEIEGGDPTALIGMPLIAVANMLRENGVQVP